MKAKQWIVAAIVWVVAIVADTLFVLSIVSSHETASGKWGWAGGLFIITAGVLAIAMAIILDDDNWE